MTPTGHQLNLKDLVTVEVRESDVKVTGRLSDAEYLVSKDTQGPFFKITTPGNLMPAVLNVKFTKEKDAVDYVSKFLETKKPTKLKATKLKYERNHPKKEPEVANA